MLSRKSSRAISVTENSAASTRLVCDNLRIRPQDAVGRTAERLLASYPPSAALRSSSARPQSTSRNILTRQIRHLDLRPNVRCSGACSCPMRLLGFRVGYSEAALHNRPLLADCSRSLTSPKPAVQKSRAAPPAALCIVAQWVQSATCCRSHIALSRHSNGWSTPKTARYPMRTSWPEPPFARRP